MPQIGKGHAALLHLLIQCTEFFIRQSRFHVLVQAVLLSYHKLLYFAETAKRSNMHELDSVPYIQTGMAQLLVLDLRTWMRIWTFGIKKPRHDQGCQTSKNDSIQIVGKYLIYNSDDQNGWAARSKLQRLFALLILLLLSLS